MALLSLRFTRFGVKCQSSRPQASSSPIYLYSKCLKLISIAKHATYPIHIQPPLQIVETEDTFELVWHIPLNGSASKISKTDRYLKNGEVVEAARRDGRPGLLRSQLTFTPEGHVHIRCASSTPCEVLWTIWSLRVLIWKESILAPALFEMPRLNIQWLLNH